MSLVGTVPLVSMGTLLSAYARCTCLATCLSSVNGSIQQRREHMSRRLCAPSLKALSSNEQCRHGCEQLAQSRRTQPRLGRRDGICRSYTVGRYQSVWERWLTQLLLVYILLHSRSLCACPRTPIQYICPPLLIPRHLPPRKKNGRDWWIDTPLR